ncbi:tRNA-intron lyase [Candidatus Woesearchaeota archaeon]|nr:tRNA-intron lyase [Candidatus Woesearchaeota archaeon]
MPAKKTTTKTAAKTTPQVATKTAAKKVTTKERKKIASAQKQKISREAKATKEEQPVTNPQLLVVDNASKKQKNIGPIKTTFARERVITEDTDLARELFNQSAFGTVLEDGKVQLSLTEALYLMEKKKIVVLNGKNNQLDFPSFVSKASRVEPKFWIRYAVYKDMRNRGYVVKTALKFGADFRVYDRGIKPGQDHARWIVYPVHEGEKYTWFDFAAKNRVAHSTKKRLMMGVVDDENDVTYWEIKWVRP